MRSYLFVIAISVLLFSTASAQIIPASLQPTPGKGYLLGPGDQIAVKVLGEEQFNFAATVDENGHIRVPYDNVPLVAKCLSQNELTSAVSDRLTKLLRSPQMSLEITKRNILPVTVYGEVNSAKEIELRRAATLVEVLAVAAGPKDEASGMVQVFRTQPPKCATPEQQAQWEKALGNLTVPSEIYKLADLKTTNPPVYPGDVVVVEKALPVYLTGEVLAPQGIYLKAGGTTLTEALAKIGGIRPEAKTKDIKIYRMKDGSKERETIAANLDQIKKGLETDPLLEPYDIVEVDKSKKSLGMTILEFALGAGKTAITSSATSLGYRTILY
ncbi:MAG: SLBB domain-containing protein [Pyrinomonadaceae bacterium]